MSIDQVTPRSRRAILAGAIGGLATAAVSLVHAPSVRAGVDGDVVLDAVNTGVGTTEIDGGDPAFAVSSSGTAIHAAGGVGVDASGDPAARGLSTAGVGVLGASAVAAVDIPAPIAASTGVYGVSPAGHAIYGASDTGVGVYAANNSSTVGAIVAEGGPGTAIHGHANVGPVPASPGLTGIYGSATDVGVAIAADSASGLAVKATSSLGPAIRGHGQLDGIIGESATGRSGIVGYSGSGSAPAGPAKTGVYGEATQDAGSRGVGGFTLAGQGVHGDATTGQGVVGAATTGQGVKGTATTGDAVLGQSASGKSVHGIATTGQGVVGEATTGAGVRAVATTGFALDVAGRMRFSRAGSVSLLANKTYVDVTVPGGLSGTPVVFAMMEYGRSGAWVVAARPNYPSTGKIRIYMNKVASTTASTPIGWFVAG
jgi:hypothetical protein